MPSTNWWDDLPQSGVYGAPSRYPTVGLPSRSTTSNMGTTPGPSGSRLDSGGNIDWGKVIGTGATLATSLAAGNSGSITPDIRDIQERAQSQFAQGLTLAGEGQAAIGPLLKYFKDLMSGNPADVLAATAPQRRRVIDQYDTARRSSAEFTPRGGGEASSQMESRSREAGDLASITADAQNNAASAMGQIGSSELTAGLSLEEAAQSQLAQALGPLFQQQQSSTANTIATYAGIAAMIASFL